MGMGAFVLGTCGADKPPPLGTDDDGDGVAAVTAGDATALAVGFLNWNRIGGGTGAAPTIGLETVVDLALGTGCRADTGTATAAGLETELVDDAAGDFSAWTWNLSLPPLRVLMTASV
jgi:hypothetical protein